MSRYLIDRIDGHPRVELRPRTRIAGLRGDGVLGEVDLVDGNGVMTTEKCGGLFCFIGADAATGWLPPEVHLDKDGFVLTDRDLERVGSEAADPARRVALPFESSVPGVFAVGDVRRGSIKRVAAAVGEGASAIRSAHQYLAVQGARTVGAPVAAGAERRES